MPKIRILPEGISNKIAAGEVVERPASVVKELVENALDAGSSRILVEVEKGGRALVRVSDNGLGMGRDDALLALERYATSKIHTDKDLFSIKTLGFRGEAIPSIAAVSRFTLVTNDTPSEPGTEIRVEGGKILRVTQIGAPLGTLVTVEDLFFNTPARRKFMKSIPTEMGHIGDMIDRVSLGWPRVSLELTSSGKSIRRFSSETLEMRRVVEVFGDDLTESLYEIRYATADLEISGWVASPEETRSTSRWIFIYVNGRFVRDRTLQHALMEGYRGKLVKGIFPMAVLKVRIPEDQVDVNVHPSKNEVRLFRQHWIHDQVAGAVAKTLEGIERFKWIPTSESRSRTSGVREEPASFRPARTSIVSQTSKIGEKQTPLWEASDTEFLRLIGQFRQTYILCETLEGLLLIDQHAAHERILFEQLQDADRTLAQRMIVPETLELGFRETRILAGLLPALNALGVEIEVFGENSFVIKSAPALLGGKALMPMIRELVDKASDTGIGKPMEEAIDHCLAVIACHAAVRAGQTLSKEAMEDIVSRLHACRNPAHCPHGRPAYIQWTDAFLEKAFYRAV